MCNSAKSCRIFISIYLSSLQFKSCVARPPPHCMLFPLHHALFPLHWCRRVHPLLHPAPLHHKTTNPRKFSKTRAQLPPSPIGWAICPLTCPVSSTLACIVILSIVYFCIAVSPPVYKQHRKMHFSRSNKKILVDCKRKKLLLFQSII